MPEVFTFNSEVAMVRTARGAYAGHLPKMDEAVAAAIGAAFADAALVRLERRLALECGQDDLIGELCAEARAGCLELATELAREGLL